MSVLALQLESSEIAASWFILSAANLHGLHAGDTKTSGTESKYPLPSTSVDLHTMGLCLCWGLGPSYSNDAEGKKMR